ncbi:hypothetical protein ELS19_04870 [Halogeometricum borinquense]|uniref:Glycerophosphoryl diester phosphodiesterase membrane domain-containing protein n=1 Tax=Halogeometricum borinquense TaxID=60847 RepID=A0A482TJ23_9EURY|nr:hypothetical protein [Halogeometricum borinquense]RYJ13361.1 hypothetical protein ELS19_04870 [Halogeometricum borinquense]
MSWHAIDSLDDARAAATDLLFPFDIGTWLRLALIVIFVGTGASNASVNANFGGTVSSGAPTTGLSAVPFDELPPLDPSALSDGQAILMGIAALTAVLLLCILTFSFVGAVMEFVLITALSDRTVRVRGPFRKHIWKGARLFGFQLGVIFLALLVVGVPIVLLVFGGATIGPELLLAVVPVLLLGVALALVVSLLFRLTMDFVVPTMLVEECGVLDGWRRLFPTLRAEWEEFALYVVVRIALGVLIGALFAAGALFVAVLVAFPFVVVGGVAFVAFTASGPIPLVGWALLGLVVVLYVVAIAIASAFLLVPVVTFLRYYALYVLGRVDDGLDLVGASPQETGGDQPDDSVAA